jgi:hypothetical protein
MDDLCWMLPGLHRWDSRHKLRTGIANIRVGCTFIATQIGAQGWAAVPIVGFAILLPKPMTGHAPVKKPVTTGHRVDKAQMLALSTVQRVIRRARNDEAWAAERGWSIRADDGMLSVTLPAGCSRGILRRVSEPQAGEVIFYKHN